MRDFSFYIGNNRMIVKQNPESDPEHPHLLIINNELYRANFNVNEQTMTRITYQDLTNMAKSGDANERKRGFGMFQKWIKAAPEIPVNDRLTQMEREVLSQLFEQKGLVSATRQKEIDAKKRLR